MKSKKNIHCTSSHGYQGCVRGNSLHLLQGKMRCSEEIGFSYNRKLKGISGKLKIFSVLQWLPEGLPRWHKQWGFCLPMQEMQETWVQSLGQEDPLEWEIATHSSILAWKIPWTGRSGGLQSMGPQGVGCDWAPQHEFQKEEDMK